MADIDTQEIADLFEGVGTEEEMVEALQETLGLAEITTRTFGDNGLLTRNNGLVITTPEGLRFHATIVLDTRSHI